MARTIREMALHMWVNLKSRLRGRPFKDAAVEVAVTVATAPLPVWFFPLMALVLRGTSSASTMFDKSVSEGEFFLFCTSLVGPLLYMLFQIHELPQDQQSHHFKYR